MSWSRPSVVGAEPVLRARARPALSSRFCAFCVYGASHGAPKHATIRITSTTIEIDARACAGRTGAGTAASCVRATGSAPGASSGSAIGGAAGCGGAVRHESRIRGSSTP